MVDDVILNALAQGQKKEDAYKHTIQQLSDKKYLAQIQSKLSFASRKIEEGKWDSTSRTKKKTSSDFTTFILQKVNKPTTGELKDNKDDI